MASNLDSPRTFRELHNLPRRIEPNSPRRIALMMAACAAWCVLALASVPARAQQVREPLPLDVAVSTHGHDTRSSFEFSPDGQWIAYTWSLDETVPESLGFTATGDPMAEGNDRKQVGVTNTQTGDNVAIGDPKAYNWAPVWSPDGKRIAFYSDSGGEAGVWIWDKATGKTERFPGAIARSFFGYEIIRWSADSQRILCKIVPEGLTLQQANALMPKNMAGRQFPAVGPDQASVIVQKAGAKEAEAEKADPSKPKESEWTNRSLSDLAILDLRDHSVKRIVKRAKISWFEFSPDEKYAGYTAIAGWETNTQQGIYNVFVQPIGGGDSRKLAENVRLGYGIELNWSPDSSRLAYVSCGQMGTGEVVLISVADGATKSLASKDIPSLNDGEGEWPPLWDSTGQNIYGKSADNKVWRIDVASGKGTLVAEIPNYKVMGIVTRNERRALWTTDGGRTIWVVAREREGSKAGIFSIDLASGQSHAVQVDERSYSNIFNLDGSDASGALAYVAKDQQHLADVWILDTKSGKTHQASHINQAMEHYELGTARIIDWYGMDGQKLHGALLLPPGYQKGKRLPLIVWVYGGMNGSNYVNNFGFWGDYPQFNMHVFATRGYAVLAPDAPLGDGTPMVDLVKTVIPGVDAAVEQGYADPERVAVMGQSYGSYCTLALIAQTKRFKAAVITAAVLHPDVVADYLHVIGGTGYFEQGQGNMHGTPWDHRERYLENSPVYLFDQIQTPLLIGQGSADGDLIPSDATFSALQRLGKEVEYRVYENEGHVLANKPNVLDFWIRRLDFIAEHMNMEVDAKGGVVFDGDRPKARGN